MSISLIRGQIKPSGNEARENLSSALTRPCCRYCQISHACGLWQEQCFGTEIDSARLNDTALCKECKLRSTVPMTMLQQYRVQSLFVTMLLTHCTQDCKMNQVCSVSTCYLLYTPPFAAPDTSSRVNANICLLPRSAVLYSPAVGICPQVCVVGMKKGR
jgi:hypothetical protein